MASTKVDYSEVLRLLSETKNRHEVARRLGIHVNTVQRAIRLDGKKCTRCMAPVLPGHPVCAKCLEWDRERVHGARKERKRLGLCLNCEKQRTPISRLYCDEHRLAAIGRNEKYHYRKKAKGSLPGAPHGAKQNPAQRRETIKERYGDGAVARWDETGGKCEVCAIAYGDMAVHMHHIDENPSNNAFENFACLCFRCHQTVHFLIASANRIGLIAWFERTYVDRPLR